MEVRRVRGLLVGGGIEDKDVREGIGRALIPLGVMSWGREGDKKTERKLLLVLWILKMEAVKMPSRGTCHITVYFLLPLEIDIS
jgi:hypothetical protein